MVALLTILCIIAYIAGLVLLVKITPGMIKRAYDDALFIPVAAAAVAGAMLVFGAVGVVYGLFNGAPGARGFDAVMLLVLLVVALRTGLRVLRPRYGIGIGTNRISRILTGGFFFVLVIAALYTLVQIFLPA